MVFVSEAQLVARFKALGANRIFCKHLAENDNSKQQIYLGGNFEVLSFFHMVRLQPFLNSDFRTLRQHLTCIGLMPKTSKKHKGHN